MAYLTADELLAGSAVTHTVEIPADLLPPRAGSNGDGVQPGRVRMRPLTVHDIQRATKAARDDDALLSVLMLKEALVEPELSFEQLNELPAGVARILLHELNRVSGLSVDEESLGEAVQAPLARACFALAGEFGWSAREIGELTVGQVLLYLEMLEQGRSPAKAR